MAGCTAHPSPSGGASPAIACDDAHFLRDRAAFEQGSLAADQPVDVCGIVLRVLRARETRSGAHGYFVVRLPSGDDVEVISNLDAMARAGTDRPPPWPWVARGDYVYVQGRYFYDGPARDGIDWTEDDIGRSWLFRGYVTVCAPSRTHCATFR